MSNSIITQKRIAKEFKRQVIDDGLESVSVSKLMKNVGMRRQTFYDYFLDKYDLVSWIFRQEATELIEDYIDYSRWYHIIDNLMVHFELNKLFYQNVLLYSGQNAFNKYFKRHVANLIDEIYKHQYSYPEDKGALKVNNQLNPEMIRIYTNGIVESTSEWIMEDCQLSAKNFSHFICTFIIQVLTD